jgi:hypothetical protein
LPRGNVQFQVKIDSASVMLKDNQFLLCGTTGKPAMENLCVISPSGAGGGKGHVWVEQNKLNRRLPKMKGV